VVRALRRRRFGSLQSLLLMQVLDQECGRELKWGP
jgi:hypothetical protein